MKKIIIFLVILKCIYADDNSINKIDRLENRLKELNKKNIKIEDNRRKYNQLMKEYRIISSQYQNLINLCKKEYCTDKTKDLNRNFRKLKESINTLDDMRETDIAHIASLEKQEKVINLLIEMEKSKVLLNRSDVEKEIDRMSH